MSSSLCLQGRQAVMHPVKLTQSIFFKMSPIHLCHQHPYLKQIPNYHTGGKCCWSKVFVLVCLKISWHYVFLCILVLWTNADMFNNVLLTNQWLEMWASDECQHGTATVVKVWLTCCFVRFMCAPYIQRLFHSSEIFWWDMLSVGDGHWGPLIGM